MRPTALLALLLTVLFAVISTTEAAPVLTKGLQNIRAEFNSVFPKRDNKSDGWIGDYKHSKGNSGHNPDISGKPEYRDGDKKDEVRAIDVDKDLKSSAGVTMEDVVQYLLAKGRTGTYLPIRYIIYNRRIWSKDDSWKQRPYNGDNAHTEHLHISGDYGTAARTQKADEWTGKLGLASVKHNANNGGGGNTGGGGLPKYKNGSRENSKKKNNKGTDVQALQKFIGSRCGTADGMFGDKTESCVKWFQGTKKLKQDGVAGPKTWAPILKALGRRLRTNDEGDE